MTRETVWCETPASLATSAITAVRRRPTRPSLVSREALMRRGPVAAQYARARPSLTIVRPVSVHFSGPPSPRQGGVAGAFAHDPSAPSEARSPAFQSRSAALLLQRPAG